MGGEGASNGRIINQVATGTKLKSKTGGKGRGANEDILYQSLGFRFQYGYCPKSFCISMLKGCQFAQG